MSKPKKSAVRSRRDSSGVGAGGETHQSSDTPLTTNQGLVVSDNQSSLKAGARGPTLLEDFVLREKITHFDHERIPERIVHARGSGAHGHFQSYRDWSSITQAAFLKDPKQKTPVFVRFSTVAGGAGSVDTPRDVRGFAVKFYTTEGNFDLVGNNIPVFFIQDAMKFPDLVHSVKMEPDRGFPQAGSAHDTFWDFVSLTPESTHMLMWAMSDRTIPRSLRAMEGFGVHTFRFVTASGESQFVKFHWRPLHGSASTTWDEAVKLAGADPDFQRRDLWSAIESGTFPEWELSVQIFDQKTADALPFDVLDPTKLIPEETIALTPIGKLTLDRNPDNFFAETEQIAFHPGHVVPGIDFSNDPLLQGRLHSYLDTQLSRLGGANFHEIPINAPKCPFQNYQRDGHMRHAVAKGRVNYEPNSLDPNGPRESKAEGFVSFPEPLDGRKERVRPETFADHYSQARLFWRSMTETEQRHIVSAFTFELGKVETLAIRKRMLGRLALVDAKLCKSVEDGLGMPGAAEKLTPAAPVKNLEPSAMLSLMKKAKPTLEGRKIGVLVADGTDAALVEALRAAVTKAGATFAVVAPKIAGARSSSRSAIAADHALDSGPSIFFDAVAVLVAGSALEALRKNTKALDWMREAHGHCKVMAIGAEALPLMKAAGLTVDDGTPALGSARDCGRFVKLASAGRHWERERD